MADPKPEVGKDVGRGEIKDTTFEYILNFRDVGKAINAFLGEKYVLQTELHNSGANTDHVLRRVAEGRVFRSARPGKPHLRTVECFMS
jgi:hypothetical protein